MSHGAVSRVVRIVVVGLAVAVWVLGAFYVMPFYRVVSSGLCVRACFENVSALSWAREMYLKDHGSPITDFGPDSRRALLTNHLIKNNETWPDDPGQGPGTGDHYVLIADTRDPAATEPDAPPELRVACVRHGFPGPRTTIRQQFVDAGVTDPDLLARCYPGSPGDFSPSHPLEWLVHPFVGPLLLGAILVFLVRRVVAW